jgi:hypothetical protein
LYESKTACCTLASFENTRVNIFLIPSFASLIPY